MRSLRATAGVVVLATICLPLAASAAEIGGGAHRSARVSPRPATWSTKLLAPGPTDPYALACPTALRCTVVGGGAEGDGAILETTDSGRTWTRERAPTGTSDLLSVTCATASFCMAMYEYDSGGVASISYPAYVVSVDGGARWSTARGTVPDELGGTPTCAGPSRCYALSDTADVYRSTDEGATWKQLATAGWSDVDEIACVPRSTCFVVGPASVAAGATGAVEFGRIVGFGERVLPVAKLASVPDLRVHALACTSIDSCSILGTTPAGADELATTDAGRTWSTHRLVGIHSAFDLSCAGSNDCVAVGTARFGHGPLLAASTDDGGATWDERAVAADPYGYAGAVACTATARCLALGTGVGQDAVLARPGATSAWSLRSLPSGPSVLSAVACTSVTVCVAVGDGNPLLSTDAGATWAGSASPLPSGTSLDTLACPSATTCIAGGDQPTGATTVQSALYRTSDGGATWHDAAGVPHDQSVSAVACATSTTCVAATTIWSSPGSGPVESRLLRSTDAGATWTSSPTLVPYVTGISCGSAASCVAVAWDGGVYTSSDAGASWAGLADVSTTFGSVSCVTATTCWASGARPTPGQPAVFSQTVVYQSTNGGSTWSLRTTPDAGGVGTISCDTSVCLLVGSWPGSLEFSVDDGVTWTDVALPSDAPYPSQAILSPSGIGVVVGGDDLNGAFVATSS